MFGCEMESGRRSQWGGPLWSDATADGHASCPVSSCGAVNSAAPAADKEPRDPRETALQSVRVQPGGQESCKRTALGGARRTEGLVSSHEPVFYHPIRLPSVCTPDLDHGSTRLVTSRPPSPCTPSSHQTRLRQWTGMYILEIKTWACHCPLGQWCDVMRMRLYRTGDASGRRTHRDERGPDTADLTSHSSGPQRTRLQPLHHRGQHIPSVRWSPSNRGHKCL